MNECLKLNHPLEEILRTGGAYDEYTVVNWCPECGAIVVDVEYDGRVSPDHKLKMKLPRIAKEAINAS